MIEQILKRDGRLVAYDITKIEKAIAKSMNAVGENDFKTAHKLALYVEEELNKEFSSKTPTVEQIQDVVEK